MARVTVALSFFSILASCSDEGHSLPRDIEAMRVAAETGRPDAMYALSSALEDAEQYKEADVWLERAAEAGQEDAVLRYFDFAQSFGRTDNAKARHFVRVAAGRGNGEACYRMTQRLKEEQVPSDIELEKWYVCATNAGVAAAHVDYSHFLAAHRRIDDAHRIARAGLRYVDEQSVVAQDLRRVLSEERDH